MNSNSGGFDISSLTRQALGNPGPSVPGHPHQQLHHPSAFSHHHLQPQHPHHQLSHQQQHHQPPLLLPNPVNLGNPSAANIHGHHMSPVQGGLPGHHLGPVNAPGPSGLHHGHFNHAGLHHPHPQSNPQMPLHPTALHHPSSLHHQPPQPSVQPGQLLHQPIHHQSHLSQHQPPVNPQNHHHAPQIPHQQAHPQQQPGPPMNQNPAPPVMADATNALASSVNLCSVHPLVDLLVELPMPSEAPEVGLSRMQLISDEEQNSLNDLLASIDQQHTLSQTVASPLINAKLQLDQMGLIFNPVISDDASNSSGGNQGQSGFSQKLLSSSYLLSLLQQQNAFGSQVSIPVVRLPAQQPQQLQQQQQQPQQQVHPPPPPPQQNLPPPSQSTSHLTPPQPQQQPSQLLPPQTQTSQQHQQHHSQHQAHQQQPPPQPPPSQQQQPISVHHHQSQTQQHQQQQQQQQQHYWSPWSENQQPPQVQQVHSPYVSSPPATTPPCPPRQSSGFSQTPGQGQMYNNDNSNSSSSFSTDPSNSMVPQHPHSMPQTMPQQQSHHEMNAYGQNLEAVVVLEKNEEMELALQEYYEKANGPDPYAPSLADRIKSNKRHKTPHSKSKSKGEARARREESHSPVKKHKAPLSPPSYSASSTGTQLTTLGSSLPAPEKFDAMLDELFDLGKANRKKSSSDTDDSGGEGDNHNSERTNGASVPALFDITLNGNTLAQFVSVTAKLKKGNQTQSAPVSKITNLLTVLTQQITVQSAGLKRRKSVEGANNSDEEDDSDCSIATSNALMQKFESCCDCCLVSLNLLSSRGMSSRVYLEECIEQVIAFLNSTIQQYTTIGSMTSSSPSKSKSKSPKKSNNFISPAAGANKKLLARMYTKWSELIGLLVEMLTLRAGSLTDTLVLSTTRLALGAFFLENLTATNSNSNYSGQSKEIQLNALKLTTTIFAQYPVHRGVILDELLHSIARLPTTKRTRATYKIDGEDGSASISMFSALLLQLIQSLFKKCKPPKESKNAEAAMSKKEYKEKKLKLTAQILKQQYDSALKVAVTFLTTFLRKCCGLTVGGQTASSDSDYRVLFEGLVADLMTTLHKPTWPAAQLLTQVLVKILITNITSPTTTKSTKGSGVANANQNLKLASIDHLGTICSRFAKELSNVETVKNEVKTSLNSILTGEIVNRRDSNHNQDSANGSDHEENDEHSSKSKKKKKRKSARNVLDFLQSDEKMSKEIWKHLIRYCDEEKIKEEKNLLVAIWLREMEREIEQQNKNESTESGVDSNGLVNLTCQDQFDAKVKVFMNLYKNAANANAEEDEYHVIDSKTAELIIRYLDISQATTVKLFDSALAHVIAALSNTGNTTTRSRAMKSLSNILSHAKRENATALLARSDLQWAMKSALLDSSTSVREATIDLIGKFILSAQSEELIDKYYDIISDRVLDTGVSVRKRVIKILREICLAFPSYKKVPDICSRIIKRINDDGEGIRKLVTETFTSMWFKDEKDREAVRMKVTCINHVVATVLADRIGTEWLQQLLTNLFAAQNEINKKKTVVEISMEEDDDKPAHSAAQLQQVISASIQIIEILVSEILCGDNSIGSDSNSQPRSTILAAITTIWLFAKVSPHLLLNHISTLHPYLSTRCTTQLDIMVLSKVVQTLELVLSKLPNASESLLRSIEEDLTKNILQNNAAVLDNCVSCLATVIHKHTNNRDLAQDLFKKFFLILDHLYRNPNLLSEASYRSRLLRALFTCGLFAKHFDFLEEKDRLFEILVQFVRENRATSEHPQARDRDILSKALTGLGFMFERNPQYTLRMESQEIYKSMLTDNVTDVTYQELAKCQVLKNLTNYLSDEFNNEMKSQVNWSQENLKSMSCDEGDSNSVQSSIIQMYLADVLGCTLSQHLQIRRAAVNLIHIIHNGGHVHPLQLVPYLIAMSSDDDVTIRFRADHVLNEIERKYHGFVSMKSKQGVHLSYQLHSHSGRRGYRIESVSQTAAANASSSSSSDDKLITGRLATLYSVVAGSRQSRRAFISGLLKCFDVIGGTAQISNYSDSMINVSLNDSIEEDQSSVQQFVCDNIIWLPYSLWDEPLYILQQLEVNLSILASNIQSQMRDALNLTDEDEDAMDSADAASDAKKSAEEQDVEMNDRSVNDSGDSSGYFNSDLKSYLPKPMPSFLALVEWVKVLKAYYMLIWCKHMLRDLFSITDAKVQDYSPNENQKVWDKPAHRKHIDVNIVDKLMMYPEVNIDTYNFDENIRARLLAEYKRFKNVQLIGVDALTKGKQ